MISFLLFLSLIFSPQPAAAASNNDFCGSIHLQTILDVVRCKKDNCTDDSKKNDDLYTQACTQLTPGDLEKYGSNIRIDTSADTLRSALMRVNESYVGLEALVSIRTETPIKFTELSPCDCLAAIEARVKCGIEQCTPVIENPPAANPPAPEPEAKQQIPAARNNVAVSGGTCSLGIGENPELPSRCAWLSSIFGACLMFGVFRIRGLFGK